MAWSSSAIPAAILAARAADKPLLGTNIIVAPSTAKWTEAGGVASTDRTLATHPACRAYDGLGGLYTKPNTTSSATWYLVFDLGSLKYFDMVALFVDWSTVGSSTFTIEVADNSTFATNLTSIGAPSQGYTNRSNLTPLGDGATLYRAQYVRLKITRATPFTPQVGELMLLRTRQLKSNPDEPWGPDDLESNTETTTTAGGVVHKTRWYNRQRRIAAQIVTGESTWADEVIAFNRECARGNGSFVWCDRPTASPALWNLMLRDDDNFQFPYSDFCRREFTLEAHEQGPQSYYLDVEVNG
jgi:hypothetical protein